MLKQVFLKKDLFGFFGFLFCFVFILSSMNMLERKISGGR